MRKLTIARAMLATATLAVVVAALRDASPGWAAAVTLATLAILACSAFGLAYRSGPARAGWLGFAVFGWGYLALTVAPSMPEDSRAALPTSRAILFLHDQWKPRADDLSGWDAMVVSPGTLMQPGGFEPVGPTLSGKITLLNVTGGTPSLRLFAHDFAHFDRIGHCTFALLAGLIGAAISRRFERGARRLATDPAGR